MACGHGYVGQTGRCLNERALDLENGLQKQITKEALWVVSVGNRVSAP